MKKLTILTLPLMFATTLALTACQTSNYVTTATNHTDLLLSHEIAISSREFTSPALGIGVSHHK